MNMLPRALYGERDWRAALKETLANPRLACVSGGEAGGRQFYCAGIFGAPALWTGARESIRASNIAGAIRQARSAFSATFSRRVRCRIGNQQDSASSTAIVVICPLISSAIRSDSAAFEVAALDLGTARDAFSLALNALFSSWRLDSSVSRTTARSLRVFARGKIPAVLDGEELMLDREVKIEFVQDCFRALVPDAEQVGQAAAANSASSNGRQGVGRLSEAR